MKRLATLIGLFITGILMGACALPTITNKTGSTQAAAGTSVEATKQAIAQIGTGTVLTLTALAPSPTQPAPATATPVLPTATWAPLPTLTPLSKNTPLPVPTYNIGHVTPTATVYAGTPKPKIAEYSCYQTLQLPPIGAQYHVRDVFDAHWQIVNVDYEEWTVESSNFYYANGTKLQTNTDSIRLPHKVKPGEKVDLVIDMTVPDLPGNYSTSWVLTVGKQVKCILTVTISAY